MTEQAFFVLSVERVDLAVSVHEVDSVSSIEAPTPVPGAPAHVLGLVAAGDRVLPLVDLGRFLGLEDSETPASDPLFQRMLIVRGGGYEAGLICRRARGLVSVSPDDIRAPAVLRGSRLRRFVTSEIDTARGVAGVLDLPALLEAASIP